MYYLVELLDIPCIRVTRDSGIVQFVDRNQICNMIDLLCTVYKIALCYLCKIVHMILIVIIFHSLCYYMHILCCTVSCTS